MPKPNKRTKGSGARTRRSGWTRSNIKCLPFVTSEYVDRKTGQVKHKDVEQMLCEFKRRVQKSLVLEDGFVVWR